MRSEQFVRFNIAHDNRILRWRQSLATCDGSPHVWTEAVLQYGLEHVHAVESEWSVSELVERRTE